MIATTVESYNGSFNYASSLKAISAALSNLIEDQIFCGNVMTSFVGNVYSIACTLSFPGGTSVLTTGL
jgi:hypothetical protein